MMDTFIRNEVKRLKETNRINDSIALSNKLEEEKRLLADQLEKEKEEARLAQIVKEKAREQERKDIQNAIDALEDIYFGFDLSNIKSKINEVELFLKDVNIDSEYDVNNESLFEISNLFKSWIDNKESFNDFSDNDPFKRPTDYYPFNRPTGLNPLNINMFIKI